MLVVPLVAVILLTTFCFPGAEINNSTQAQGKKMHAEYNNKQTHFIYNC
jgi:hypothetical protein